MKRLPIYILKLLLNGIYAPMKLMKTANKVTFISRQSDHVSEDFIILNEALKRESPDTKVIILCKQISVSIGTVINTIKQMYHIATSKTVVLDSYCIPISVLKHKKELVVIQMWHSMGCMKAFGFAMIGKEEGRDPIVAELMNMHRGYDYILISSLEYIQDYIDGFRTSPEKVLEIPLPKADCLTDKSYMDSIRKKILSDHSELEGKKNILYCPTFRQVITDYDYECVSKLLDCIDYTRYNFIYKPHPVSRMIINDERVISFDGSNIEALAISDYVISDYSSIIYEAGLVGVPVFLYGYDWDEYKNKRDLNLDIKNEVPTLMTDNPELIVKAIDENLFNYDSFQEFTKHNIKMPKNSTCCKEIIKLMHL